MMIVEAIKTCFTNSNELLFIYNFYQNFTSCFLGIIYDVIVEPPSVGSTTDESGHSKPVS